VSDSTHGSSSSVVALAAVIGYLVLTAALGISFGLPSLPGLVLLLLLLLLLLAVAGRQCSPESQDRAQRLLPSAVGLVALLQFAGFSLVTVGLGYSKDVPVLPLGAGLLVLGVTFATYLSSTPPRWTRWRFPLLLAAAGFLAAWHVGRSPTPGVDSWGFQMEAVRFLLRGENPYRSVYPTMGDEDYYAPSVVKDGHMQTYPYAPLQLLLTVPGYLLGDVRWVMVAALVGAAALIGAVGRAAGSEARQQSETAAALFLCNPVNPFLIDKGWSEPLLALAAAGCLWAAAERRSGWLVVALGGLLGVKQYGVLAALPLGASRQLTWRTTAAAVALAVATLVPFLVCDAPALWLGVVRHHLDVPLRLNSLSVPAALAACTEWRLPGAVGFAAALVAAVIAFARRTPSLGQATLGGAAVVLAFFLFGKGGHLNYYWFAASMLPMAFAASAPASERHPPPVGSAQEGADAPRSP
jgi:hypothetical protein